MAITLPYQQRGRCIVCGDKHKREPRSWRCWSCDDAVQDARAKAVRAIKKAIESGEMPSAEAIARASVWSFARMEVLTAGQRHLRAA